MAIDNTHTKYLRGADKKTWNNYADALKAQSKLDGFLGKICKGVKAGETYEVPVRKGNKDKKKSNNKNN